ncbi:hypothetical protein J6590_086773 [Homalodisca vitripennis]|nr:hypothetical protein J6590_086773 [Homalodisca vitripennis]
MLTEVTLRLDTPVCGYSSNGLTLILFVACLCPMVDTGTLYAHRSDIVARYSFVWILLHRPNFDFICRLSMPDEVTLRLDTPVCGYSSTALTLILFVACLFPVVDTGTDYAHRSGIEARYSGVWILLHRSNFDFICRLSMPGGRHWY